MWKYVLIMFIQVGTICQVSIIGSDLDKSKILKAKEHLESYNNDYFKDNSLYFIDSVYIDLDKDIKEIRILN